MKHKIKNEFNVREFEINLTEDSISIKDPSGKLIILTLDYEDEEIINLTIADSEDSREIASIETIEPIEDCLSYMGI
jgi:hypothetical protein